MTCPAVRHLRNFAGRLYRPPRTDRADLHVHSTASDGLYTPRQLVDLATRTGLAALAVTDHDTLAGSIAVQQFAQRPLEIIPAVEMSCESQGREVHLLGYFIDFENKNLLAALQRLRIGGTSRYLEMVAKLRRIGVDLPDDPPPVEVAAGRRHLAHALVAAGRVGTVREAFHRYLDDRGPVVAPKLRICVDEGIALIRTSGGVSSYAHPGQHVDRTMLAQLADAGLGGVEAEYPGFRANRTAELRGWARELGLAITGGSDCHGPDEPRRAVGARTISADELDQLRMKARC